MRHIRTLPFYILIAVLFGYFSQAPRYQLSPEGKAMIKLTLSHYGERAQECHKLTSAEIAALPQNMRRSTKCARERVPVFLEFEVDGETLFSEELKPTGFGKDGPVAVYEKFWVDPGPRTIEIRVRDTRGENKFNKISQKEVVLKEHQHLVVDFDPNTGLRFR